jgi:two-component sensor histidine kinase
MLVRELNHRVKNNLQIIVSLMNLRKRIMPPERREDIRFIEEHVQSMSVAYRMVYATSSMVDVSVTELITEVASGLRHIAGLSEDRLTIDALASKVTIGLDQAVALALYMAVSVPPLLDHAVATSGAVAIDLSLNSGVATLTTRGMTGAEHLDTFRLRLMRAYAEQLNAEILQIDGNPGKQLRFSIESSKVTTPDQGTEARP